MDQQKFLISPKTAKKDDGNRLLTIRMKVSVFNQIEDIIAISGHSRNEFINMLISYALSQFCGIEK